MGTESKLELLRTYVKQIAPEGDIESLAEMPSALESTQGEAVDEELETANRGIAKLSHEEELDDAEAFALEAIVLPRGRPVVDIVADSFNAPPSPWTHLGEDETRTLIEAAIPSIGRIELPEHPQAPYGGTGFVVGEGLIMTNRHVAGLFVSGLGLRGLQFLPGQEAGVDFKREVIPADPIYVQVHEVVMVHPYWDMALLRVEGLPEAQDALTLSVEHPEDLAGREVAVIGFPAQDIRNDLDLQNRIFRGIFNVKRLQPGKIMGLGRVRSFGKVVEAMKHDSSTLGGNSGSAVLDLASGDILGLHFAGRYLEANFAVPTFELARDAKVTDAGVQFGGQVPATDIWKSAWRQADPSGEETQPAVSGASSTSQRPSLRSVALGVDGATWTIPVQVTVTLGEVVPGNRREAFGSAAAVEAPRSRIEPDPNYELREGYDADFLGEEHEIPIPWLSDEQYGNVAFNRWATERRHVLPYDHFSVVMNRGRRLAFYTAVNIDGNTERSISRDDFSDKWFVDPRILPGEQLQNDLYIRNKLDRGHLVRRLDPVWGRRFSEAKSAHDDTFHWTNCSPQHEQFNRNRTTWGGIENYILHNTNNKDLRVSVFTGPVFRDDDPVYRTEDGDNVQVPLEFWKVVAVVKPEGELSATAYLLSQMALVDDMLAEEFAFGAFREFQKTVSEIEGLTGLSFHDLSKHDPLAAGAEEAAGPPTVVLRSFEDLVL